MGITDHLLNLLLVLDQIPINIGNELALTLSHITKFARALKKIENEIEFNEPIQSFIAYLLENKDKTNQLLIKYKTVN